MGHSCTHAAPRCRAPWLPAGSLGAHVHCAGWNRLGPGSWVRASPRWRPPPGSRSSCAAGARQSADGMVAGLTASLAKQVEKGQAHPRRRPTRSRPGSRPPPTSATLVGVDLVIESVVEDLAVKKALFAELDSRVPGRSHPGHQHLDPAGGRDGHGHRAAPSWCAGSTSSTRLRPWPGRGGAPGDRSRHHDQAAARVRRRLRQGARSRSRTGPGSSSTPCCSPTSTTPCASSSRAWPPRRGSTPP